MPRSSSVHAWRGKMSLYPKPRSACQVSPLKVTSTTHSGECLTISNKPKHSMHLLPFDHLMSGGSCCCEVPLGRRGGWWVVLVFHCSSALSAVWSPLIHFPVLLVIDLHAELDRVRLLVVVESCSFLRIIIVTVVESF